MGDGIKIDLRETGWGTVEWIRLSQDRANCCEFSDEPSGFDATELVLKDKGGPCRIYIIFKEK
jgi:hypothetical protein